MADENKLVGEIFGWVGTVIAIYFFTAPIVLIIQLIRSKITYKDIPGLLLIFSLINCILWADYGLKSKLIQVYVCNISGSLITLVWSIIFIIYFSEKKISKSFILITLYIVLLSAFSFIFYYIISPKITGYAAMIFNVLMFASPGEKILTVIKTGNYNLIPIFSTLGGFLCSGCSIIYGIYLVDWNIIIPNSLGLLFAILQAIFYFIYKKKNNINKTDGEDYNNDHNNEDFINSNKTEIDERKNAENKENEVNKDD